MTRDALPCPTLLDELERRYDGAQPAAAVRMAWLGGRGPAAALAHAATERHHVRLADDARQGMARRRRGMPADEASGDAWLCRLAATLAHHRHAAVTTLRVSSPPSPASGPSPPCGGAVRP